MRLTIDRGLAAIAAAIIFICMVAIPSVAVEDGYYKKPYSADIYRVEGTLVRAIDYEEWASAGFPQPSPAPTVYVRYPWSPTVYGVTFWQSEESSWGWDRLSLAQWQLAGSPSPYNAGWIFGSYYYRWGTSNEIFVLGEDGVNHKLTYDEWAASGFRPFDDRSNEGWLKLTWSPEIARMSDLAAGYGKRATEEEWRQHDYPTPMMLQRFPGDQFYQYIGDRNIHYSGPTMSRVITYGEWAGAGFPAPVRLPRPTVDCARLACVALTFDDGPSAHTSRLIDTLTSLGVPATFFVVGTQVANRPTIARALQAAGLAVENHTYSHPQLNLLSMPAQRTEVQRADDALASAGVATTSLLRPPYGSWNPDTRQLGKPLILWSVDPRDWDGRTATEIRNHVRTYTRSGDIVLMHDTVSATVDAIPGIVTDLRGRGFTLVTVRDLVPNMEPGDVVYSRGNVTESGSQVEPSAATVLSPDGADFVPMIDEAPLSRSGY